MKDWRRVLTNANPVIIGVVLSILSAYALTSFYWQRVEQHNVAKREIERELHERVADWESDQLAYLHRLSIAIADSDSDYSRLDDQLSARESVLKGFFLWTTLPSPGLDGPAAHWLYPRPTIVRTPPRHPCVIQGMQDFALDPVSQADAMIAGCYGQPMEVLIDAANEAAGGRLLPMGLTVEAEEILDHLGEEADQMRPPWLRRITRQMIRSQIAEQLGEIPRSAGILMSIARTLCTMPPGDADGLLEAQGTEVRRRLGRVGSVDQYNAAFACMERATERLRVYREIENRIIPEQTSSSAPPRIITDQYSDPPFSIYYGVVKDDTGVALQLDRDAMIDDFLDGFQSLRNHLIVVDSTNSHVAGSHARDGIALEVRFERSFKDLRVLVGNRAIAERVPKYRASLLMPILVTLLCIVMGFIGLVAQHRGARRQRLLLTRQREFSTRVTHELKTPLAGIKVMAENLSLGAWKSEEHREQMAERIVQEADRLTARVDEILAVARDRHLPEPKPFEPEEALFAVLDDWGPRLDAAGVKLHAEIDPTDEVMGDYEAIRDVVACLVDNALKYHNDARLDPQVWLTLRQEGRDAVIRVIDNGIGIPKNMRESVFQRFVRVEGDNRGRSGGHGLGLYQVRDLVTRHRGKVKCSLGVDGGTKFTVTLPTVKS